MLTILYVIDFKLLKVYSLFNIFIKNFPILQMDV